MAVEARRGCGYRKVGGIYLVGSFSGEPCHRLPVPLTVCPCCGEGIKQTRGFQWVRPAKLFEGSCNIIKSSSKEILRNPAERSSASPTYYQHCTRCPVCEPSLFQFLRYIGKDTANEQPIMDDRAGMIWIGEKFYPTPQHFIAEGRQHGISRRIKAVPRDFVLGKTFILLAHPKAAIVKGGDGEFDEQVAGVFHVFRPSAIEKVITESESKNEEEMIKLRKQGISPVIVPDNDPDHRGTVYDKEDGE